MTCLAPTVTLPLYAPVGGTLAVFPSGARSTRACRFGSLPPRTTPAHRRSSTFQEDYGTAPAPPRAPAPPTGYEPASGGGLHAPFRQRSPLSHLTQPTPQYAGSSLAAQPLSQRCQSPLQAKPHVVPLQMGVAWRTFVVHGSQLVPQLATLELSTQVGSSAVPHWW